MKSILLSVSAVLMVVGLMGCAAEVGSEKWCQQIEKKGTGNITANEAKDYAKHCVLRKSSK